VPRTPQERLYNNRLESAASAMFGRMDPGGAAEKNEEGAAIRFAHCRECVTSTRRYLRPYQLLLCKSSAILSKLG